LKLQIIYFISLLLFLLPVIAGSQTVDTHKILADSALRQVGVTTEYTPEYVRLKYPGGDLPLRQGVCADVVVRVFRKIGIDLQKEVHEDMVGNFDKYPKIWNLKKPDSNIDHRRVPNLMKFFERRGKSLRIDSEYQPGDIVAWRLDNGLFHIGIVSSITVPGTKRYYMVHNIGAGAQKEDVLGEFKIIGHYRW
jgi:uncharacterized protein YijF (DUF1287 family)